METGTIKWFSAKKGFGFIKTEDGNEIFMHFSALKMDGFKTIDDGAKVQFEITDGPKGKQAANVVKL